MLLKDNRSTPVPDPAAPAQPDPVGEVPSPLAALYWDEFVGGRIGSDSSNLYSESLERMEREVLIRVLRHTRGNQVHAARILGIARGSLRQKIRSLGINITRSVAVKAPDANS